MAHVALAQKPINGRNEEAKNDGVNGEKEIERK